MDHIAIYCRVSTKDQSCERQERELLDYALKSDYQVLGIFKETGSGSKSDRQIRAKVMQLAKAKKIKLILVSELSRWGRSLIDLIHTLQELSAYGVSVITLSGTDFNMNTPQGKLLLSVLGALAEFERELLCERVNSGLSNAKAKGTTLGRPRGHRRANQYRQRVAELRERGLTQREISSALGISITTVVEALRENEKENAEKATSEALLSI